MTKEELEEGKCYSRGDNAVYKIVAMDNNWILVLQYSFNHRIAVPWIYTSEEFIEDNLEEINENTEHWYYDIFEELTYIDAQTLKEL